MFVSYEVLTEKYDERFSLLCLASPFAPWYKSSLYSALLSNGYGFSIWYFSIINSFGVSEFKCDSLWYFEH